LADSIQQVATDIHCSVMPMHYIDRVRFDVYGIKASTAHRKETLDKTIAGPNVEQILTVSQQFHHTVSLIFLPNTIRSARVITRLFHADDDNARIKFTSSGSIDL
jgi:hypothetical protein